MDIIIFRASPQHTSQLRKSRRLLAARTARSSLRRPIRSSMRTCGTGPGTSYTGRFRSGHWSKPKLASGRSSLPRTVPRSHIPAASAQPAHHAVYLDAPTFLLLACVSQSAAHQKSLFVATGARYPRVGAYRPSSSSSSSAPRPTGKIRPRPNASSNSLAIERKCGLRDRSCAIDLGVLIHVNVVSNSSNLING